MPRNAAPAEEIDLVVLAAPRMRPAVAIDPWRRPDTLFLDDDNNLMVQLTEGPPIEATVPMRHVKRVKHLVRLRDAARRVLHAELANAPEEESARLRGLLNEIYDKFVEAFGPVNLESVSGTRIKRVNLQHFDTDPDVALVASLEEVDVETQTYTKAAIFHQAVLRQTPDLVAVDSAADALAISLDRQAKVDIPYIAALLGKSEGYVIDALAGEIYEDPETQQFVTASEYLSGPVRRKLEVAIAREAYDGEEGRKWRPNIEALKAIQPTDLTATDIAPSLGAPWIPTTDIRDFILHLLGGTENDVVIGFDERQAVWSVSSRRWDHRYGALGTATWGTKRMGAVDIIDAALNQREVTVRDPIPGTDPIKYMVNQDETLGARDKLTSLREEFTRWIWSEPKRTARLVTLYNNRYNDRREREFDGSHLSFPGMSATVDLRSHQKDAIWRAVQTGNTLLAHQVGTGKTYCEVAIALESRRLGLAKKPCIIVPNHMVEQVSRDALQLYPMAKLLVGGRDDVTPAERKKFAAKVAMSDCDLVLMTHNSFGKLPMSKGFERQLITEEITQLQIPVANETNEDSKIRERSVRRWQKKLADLDERPDKDSGVTFEETGVDLLIVDESDAFKGLPVESKNNGRTATGSKRAEDLYLRARYLNHLTPRRGLVFATGTPISNSIAELYVLQLYLQRDRLIEAGLLHFDAWAAMFGDSVTTFELAPGGGYRLATRFASFKNVPELSALFREVADVRTTEELKLPVPLVEGGGPTDIAVAPTPEQEMYLQYLVSRSEDVKNRRCKPTEDNMLKVVNDGRRAALDVRLIEPDAPDDPNSKISVAARDIAALWKETTDERLTQLVFCDISTPKPDQYNVYDEMRRKLIEEGVDSNDIAFVQDAKSDRAKHRLFEAVNRGQIRILLASTETAGVGTNVQERLIALTHLDAAWRPRDMQQRDGRIVRQGNRNKIVKIRRYVTEKSFDAYMYQGLERKARFISQVLSGDKSLRVVEDVDSVTLSFATVKAIATGDPNVKKKAELEAEVARLQRIVRQEESRHWASSRELADIPAARGRLEARIAQCADDLEARVPTQADAFRFTFNDGNVTDAREEAGKALFNALRVAETTGSSSIASQVITAGTLAGFEIGFEKVRQMSMEIYARRKGYYALSVPIDARSGIGLVRRAERMLNDLDVTLSEMQRDLDRINIKAQQLETFTSNASTQRGKLDGIVAELDVLDRQLGVHEEDRQAAVAEAGGVEEMGNRRRNAPLLNDQRPRAIDNPPDLTTARGGKRRKKAGTVTIHQEVLEPAAMRDAPEAPAIPAPVLAPEAPARMEEAENSLADRLQAAVAEATLELEATAALADSRLEVAAATVEAPGAVAQLAFLSEPDVEAARAAARERVRKAAEHAALFARRR